MDQVYANAAKTLVWLGTGKANTPAAMQLCRDVADQITGGSDDCQFEEFEVLDAVCETVEVPAGSSVSLLNDIFSCRWFERLWVFQEIVLSENCVCYIGDESIPWPHIEFVARWLLNSKITDPLLTRGRVNDAVLIRATKVPMLTLLTRLIPSFTAGVQLHHLATWTSHLGATEKRDKIFGLLSLTQWAKAGQDLPAGIRPDYRKSIRNCMRDATRVMVEEERELNALGVVGIREIPPQEHDEEPWPSWTPSWCGNENQGVALLMSTYLAHNDRPAIIRDLSLHNDPDCLCLDGFVIDGVKVLHPVIDRGSCANLLRLQHFIQHFIQQLKPVYYEEQTRSTSATDILSFLSADRARSKSFISAESDAIKALISGPTVVVGQTVPPGSQIQDGKDHNFPSASEVGEGQHLEDLRSDISQTIIGRHFFRTTHGRKGLGPKEMQEADIIAILFGGMWPFVLRKVGKHYRLIGTCYIEGIMYGEAVRECEQNGVEPESFEIY